MKPEQIEKLKARRAHLAEQRERLAQVDDPENAAKIAQAVADLDELILKIDGLVVPKVRPKRTTVRAAPRRDPILKIFEVARVPKTECAEVRVAIDARKPQRKVDIRLWFKPEGEVAMVPSRKGVTLDGAELGALITALRLAEQHLGGGS